MSMQMVNAICFLPISNGTITARDKMWKWKSFARYQVCNRQMCRASTQFWMKSTFVHQFFLQSFITGSIVSLNTGPEPKSGSRNVKEMVTNIGGDVRSTRASMNAGMLNSLYWPPLVIFQVAKVVKRPLMKKKVSTERVALMNHWTENWVTRSATPNPWAVIDWKVKWSAN